MIGQQKIKDTIDLQIKNNTLPHFLIFVGKKGSQRKELAEHIADTLKFDYMSITDLSTSNIRQIIEDVYKLNYDRVIAILNADEMRIEAKNALLKITEETPKHAIFILTVEHIDSMPETIQSRAAIYTMDKFSEEELKKYADEKFSDSGSKYILSDWISICETPYDIDKMLQHDFFNFTLLVVDNIYKVSTANVFKIDSRIALKGESDKFDLKLFWKAFIAICRKRLQDNRCLYATFIIITSYFLSHLSINVNKTMLFDNWILSIRSGEILCR